VAAGVAGVVREAERLENSLAVFACCSLIFSATGPLVTLWVMGWFLTALAAAEALLTTVFFASSSEDPFVVSTDGMGLSLAVRSDMFVASNQRIPVLLGRNSSAADGEAASARQW
jgi:hypothetical protein